MQTKPTETPEEKKRLDDEFNRNVYNWIMGIDPNKKKRKPKAPKKRRQAKRAAEKESK